MSGFKQTEVGVIPLDWTVKSFGEIGTLTKGKGLLKEDIKASGEIPAIPYTALYTEFSELLNYQRIRWFVDDPAQTYIVKEPCVLIASSSNMAENTGKASAIQGNVPVAIGREVIVFKTSSNPAYISYLLSTSLYRSRTLALARGTTIKHVYPATFANYKIGLPDSDEQAAIAEALSDADALIESLEQLHGKKRQIKQGAMQELLTGKSRLAGFTEAWQTRRLDALANIRSGGTPSTTNERFWGGNVLWCTPTDISALAGRKYLNATARTISQEGLTSSSAEIVPPQSVIMTSRATIGECAINAVSLTTNQGFKNFIPFSSVDVEFLYYMLLIQKQAFVSLCGGSTFLEIGKAQLAAFEVQLPSTKAEQSAIATLLSDIDTELDALDGKLTKARQLKQGMMQVLLTGQIRLPLDGA